jgi:hypothetical protein
MKATLYPFIDYDFRPQSYWHPSAATLAVALKNVKGTVRRRMIREAWEKGEYEVMPADLKEAAVSEPLRQALGRMHPQYMGGEYLPDYEPGEVEIARIELQSTTGDVISIRAKTEEGIHYRIVDEYGSEFDFSPVQSHLPLSVREIVKLIDGARQEGYDYRGLGLCYILANYEYGGCPEELKHFSRVESDFYPQLSTHYRHVVREWYDRECERSNHNEDYGEEEDAKN